jgi:hypothetical protein
VRFGPPLPSQGPADLKESPFFGRLLAGDPAAERLRGALRGGIAVSREARSKSLSSAVEIERAQGEGARRSFAGHSRAGRSRVGMLHDVQINQGLGDAGVFQELLRGSKGRATSRIFGSEEIRFEIDSMLRGREFRVVKACSCELIALTHSFFKEKLFS